MSLLIYISFPLLPITQTSLVALDHAESLTKLVFKNYYCYYVITDIGPDAEAVSQLASRCILACLCVPILHCAPTSQTPAASVALASPRNADASMSYLHINVQAWPQKLTLFPLAALSGVLSHNGTVSNSLVLLSPKHL